MPPLLSNEGLGYSVSCTLARLASSSVGVRSRTMKQRLAMLLLPFLGGVFVQTAAAAALSPAQAREALGQMYTSRKTNGNIDRSACRSNLVGLGSGSAPGSGLEPRLAPHPPTLTHTGDGFV